MRTATLTITIDRVQKIDDKNLVGHGRFDNGKTLDPISFTAYAPRLQDTIVPNVTIVAEGNLRAIKDAAGITSLGLNITQAMQIATPVITPEIELEADLTEPIESELAVMTETYALEAELLDEQQPIETEPVAPIKPKSTRGRKPKVAVAA
jgi:hypothetical protein